MQLTAKHLAMLQRVSAANGRRLLLQEESSGNSRVVRDLLSSCMVELGADLTVKDRKEGGPAATIVITEKGRAALLED